MIKKTGYQIVETDEIKILRSPDYNYNFNKKNGLFMRWGKDIGDDPQFSPFGPELLDCEISIGGCSGKCPFCYKNNTDASPINMTFQTFKQILDKMPNTLTQIAFGITNIQANPDFISMMRYCRTTGIIPNFTLSGIDLTDELAQECAKLVGAVAVSCYQKDKNICYDTVKKFTDLGLKQVNIHILLAVETLDFVYEVLNDIRTDARLAGLNAIVFLGVKNKGRAKDYHSVALPDFQKLIQHCLNFNYPIGFDSCSAPKFEKSIKAIAMPDTKKQTMLTLSEPCESALFSFYCNVYGKFSPCSFNENEKKWEDGGISILETDDFVKDIWYHSRIGEWRETLLKNERMCPTFDLDYENDNKSKA